MLVRSAPSRRLPAAPWLRTEIRHVRVKGYWTGLFDGAAATFLGLCVALALASHFGLL